MVSARSSPKEVKRRRPAQNHERIVSAALAMIDKTGLEAFSTRSLAARLGLKVMSLYHYFPSREALLDAAVDRMLGELRLPDVAQVAWREGLLALSREYRSMGRRHLLAIPLLAQRCPSSPMMQQFLDVLSGLLLKAGLTPPAAAQWLVIQRDYVIGSLLADHSTFLLARESKARPSPYADPELLRQRIELARDIREQVFAKGLSAMLDAIERER